MYKYFIKNNTINLIKLLNNKKVGSCNFILQNKNCYINNIYVSPKFRNQYIGSSLLNQIQNYSLNNKINKINLVIYQEPYCNLIDFYKKNKFIINESTPNNIYDDGLIIYDIIKLYKIIK